MLRQSTALRPPMPRNKATPPPSPPPSPPRDSAAISKDIGAVVIEARLQQKIKEIGLRSKWILFLRRSLAWSVSAALVLSTTIASFVYAQSFSHALMERALFGWLLAYGWTALIIEPAQVLLLACVLPPIVNGKHCLGRWLRLLQGGYKAVVGTPLQSTRQPEG